VLLACLQLCGGPQGLMQCVAWTGMLVSYAQDGTVAEAIEKTFDGQHPCPLCLAIEKAAEERDSTPAPARLPTQGPDWLKLCKEFVSLDSVTPPEVMLAERTVESVPGEPVALHGILTAAPPAPPPRLS